MPKYIKPLDPPRIKQPSDDPSGNGEFRLDGSELFLHDLYAQESVNASGTECDLFVRDLAKSKVDALYNEPIETAWDGPYRFLAHVEWPEFTPETGEEGMRSTWPSGIWIPRKTIEEVGARAPREGDVVRFWKLPYFDNRAGMQQPGPKTGFFFDITKVTDDGHINDDAVFVGFRCDLKRRSNSPPEVAFHPAKSPDDDC